MPSFTSFVNSTTADANQINTNFNFIYPDFNPFATGGSLTTNVGKLGTAGSIWAALAVGSINAAGITTSGTSVFNGPVTFGSTSTFNGVATFATNSTFNAPARFTTFTAFGHLNPSLTVDVSGNITSVVGGTAINTIRSTVNGSGVLLSTVGLSSVGTSRTARIGLNIFADDVWSLDNGTSEYLRINLSTGALGVSAGNLSVRHNNPSQTLDVNGAVAFSTYLISGSGSTINIGTATTASITVTNFYHIVTNSGMSSGSQGALEFIAGGLPGQMLMLQINPTGDSLDLVGNAGTTTSNLAIGTTTFSISPLTPAMATLRYSGLDSRWYLVSFSRI